MKKTILFLSIIPFLTACDNIGEDERYIEVEQVVSQRKVLLEEFTGQRCPNCPDAHAVIEKLEEQYGENLVVVSIHAGSFANPVPAGLMQPEGNEYADRWSITAYPSGIIDRHAEVLSFDSWASVVRNELENVSPLEIELTASLRPDGTVVDIRTELLSSSAIKGSMQLMVTEDNIVALQVHGSTRIPDYVHNNVFRTSVNGLWGEDVTLSPNVFYDFEHSVTLDGSWKPENLSIVGFVSDESGVVQVTKCKVDIP